MKTASILIGIVLLTAAGASALEILYPADKTWVIRSNYLILRAGGDPPADAVTVEINGVKSDPFDISGEQYRDAFGDFLILEPEFDPGRNVIVVEGYAKGEKKGEARAEVFFSDSPSAVPPTGFSRFVMHLPEKEAACVPCHNMKPDAAAMRASTAGANPCASCHKRMLAKKNVHGPAGVWNCAYCHPSDTKPAKYQAREGDAKVCNECHSDKVKEFKANKFVHGPVEAGLCSACHDAHATDNPAQLHAPINDLCLGCHDVIGKGVHVVRGVGGKGHPLKGVKDPSSPGKELSCTGCHDPHGGKSPYLFQRGIESRFVLCQLCHKK